MEYSKILDIETGTQISKQDKEDTKIEFLKNRRQIYILLLLF